MQSYAIRFIYRVKLKIPYTLYTSYEYEDPHHYHNHIMKISRNRRNINGKYQRFMASPWTPACLPWPKMTCLEAAFVVFVVLLLGIFVWTPDPFLGQKDQAVFGIPLHGMKVQIDLVLE